MVIKSTKFTPEVLLSAPRRGAAVPNHDGTLALYTLSTYSFETKKETKEIRILDIKTGNSTLFSNDPKVHDAKWLDDGSNAIIFLQSGDQGTTDINIGDANEPANPSYTVDTIPAPVQDLKTAPLKEGSIAIALSGLATEDGELYNKETAEKSPSTARLYNKTLVRFWDSYMTEQKNAIWYSKLEISEDKYKLAAPLQNALKDSGFESPFPDNSLLGSTGAQFDLSPTGIAFLALSPDSNPGVENFKFDAYFLRIRTFTEPKVGGYRFNSPFTGSYRAIKLSPDGSSAALIQTINLDTIDARLMLAPLNLHTARAWEVLKGENGLSAWQLTPSGVDWSRDGKQLYVTAEECARTNLFTIPALIHRDALPKKLFSGGTVTGYYPLDDKSQKLLVSSSSFVENSVFQIIDTSDPSEAVIVNSSSKNGRKYGLSHKQVSEVYFEGAGDYCVQAWVIKPSFFDKKKKYPLVLIIHGGPQDAAPDAWSTRWNPAVWAEQGYVIVAPNVTGSTGFGVDFAQGVQGEWGGRPYYDLENCWEHIAKNMPFVDTDRAIAAGGSYGGYMVNWIQGMPLGKKFKAIVSHDGIFDLHAMLGCDIVGGHEFHGPLWPWENWENVEKYSPSRPDLSKNWTTPMLVIHSEKDFRCVTSDGVAAFHVAQKHGIPSQFLNFPDEGHWVLGYENSLVWHQTVFNFINKYSGIADESATTSASASKQVKSSQAGRIESVETYLGGLSIENNPQEQTQDTNSEGESESWSQELDLRLFVAKAQGLTWEQICELYFPGKTASHCESRYMTLLADGLL